MSEESMELNRGSEELFRNRRVDQDDCSDKESCRIHIARQHQKDIKHWRNIEIELQEAVWVRKGW